MQGIFFFNLEVDLQVIYENKKIKELRSFLPLGEEKKVFVN